MTVVTQSAKPPRRLFGRRGQPPAQALTRTTTVARRRPARALLASAIKVRVDTSNAAANVVWGGTEWQREGWLHYDTCPELHAAGQIIANALSRVQLIGVDIDPTTGRPGTEATSDATVAATVGELFGGATGQSQALAAYGLNLTVAGDCWTLAVDDPDLDGVTWEILAVSEVTSNGAAIQYRRLDGTEQLVDPDTDLLFRVWRPHPKKRWEADSAVRALLPVLRELAALTAAVVATLQSRLVMNGWLLIPDEAEPPSSSSDDVGVVDDESVYDETVGVSKGQQWMDQFGQIASQTLSQPGSAASAIPLISTMPAQFIEKISKLDFAKDLDGQIDTLRQAAIKRIAVGVDMPPETLLGLESANHWSAWAISEEFVKSFIAPMLELIADALTTHYLRPALTEAVSNRTAPGGLNPDTFAIGFDVSDLLPEQMDAAKAQQAFDTGELSVDRYLEALGFDPGHDRPDAVERMTRIAFAMIARGNPQTIAELLPLLQTIMPGFPDLGPLPAPGGTPAGLPTAPNPARVDPDAQPVTPAGPGSQGPPVGGPTPPPDHTPTVPPPAAAS